MTTYQCPPNYAWSWSPELCSFLSYCVCSRVYWCVMCMWRGCLHPRRAHRYAEQTYAGSLFKSMIDGWLHRPAHISMRIPVCTSTWAQCMDQDADRLTRLQTQRDWAFCTLQCACGAFVGITYDFCKFTCSCGVCMCICDTLHKTNAVRCLFVKCVRQHCNIPSSGPRSLLLCHLLHIYM